MGGSIEIVAPLGFVESSINIRYVCPCASLAWARWTADVVWAGARPMLKASSNQHAQTPFLMLMVCLLFCGKRIYFLSRNRFSSRLLSLVWTVNRNIGSTF